MSIKTWANRDTQAIFDGESRGIVPRTVLKRAQAKLLMLHAATELKDLSAPPSNRLEKLRGDRGGQYSVRITDQFRICFEWRDGDAYEVQILDYH